MDNANFTPGPWELQDAWGNPAPYGRLVGPLQANPVAALTGYHGKDMTEANGRLLAAATELYEMLQAATAYVELATGNGVRKEPPARYIKPNGDFDAEAIARDARAILAKVAA